MNGNLITFDELHARQEIDLIGGTIEVDTHQMTYRGQLDDMFWWKSHPKEFTWIQCLEWHTRERAWRPSPKKKGTVNFSFGMIELFSGPFELDSGEIFFATGTPCTPVIAVTIFPRGQVPHDDIQSGQHYQLLKKCFGML